MRRSQRVTAIETRTLCSDKREQQSKSRIWSDVIKGTRYPVQFLFLLLRLFPASLTFSSSSSGSNFYTGGKTLLSLSGRELSLYLWLDGNANLGWSSSYNNYSLVSTYCQPDYDTTPLHYTSTGSGQLAVAFSISWEFPSEF